MRKNLHELIRDLDCAFREFDQATEARASGTFRKPFQQEKRDHETMSRYEAIVNDIKETVDYCRRLAQSIRVTRVELSTMADPLSPAFMEKEKRLFERRTEYQRLTEKPVPEPIAESAITELTQEV